MPINEKALKSHLSSGALTPVYLIYGNDNFLKKQMVDRIIKATVGQDDGFNVLRYEYGCNLEEVYEELCAVVALKERFDSAAVVIMSVGQHRRIHRGQIDAQFLGVFRKEQALAHIKKDAPPVDFQIQTQSMLRPEAAGGSILC